jgi:peptide/nickel transport system substrate-binding protein
VAPGGWSATCNYTAGFLTMDPTAHGFLRGVGQNAIFGWPTSPELESLRAAWMEAADPADQRRIAERIQLQALQDVPYIPLGGFTLASAYRRNLTGMLKAPLPLFHNLHRE